jgi:hypothetical protein
MGFQGRRGTAQVTDPGHLSHLLRPRRERPHRCTAERSNQFSPSDLDCHVTLHLGVNALGQANNTILFIGGVSDANGTLQSHHGRPFRCVA